jgi:hypothetical protein
MREVTTLFFLYRAFAAKIKFIFDRLARLGCWRTKGNTCQKYSTGIWEYYEVVLISTTLILGYSIIKKNNKILISQINNEYLLIFLWLYSIKWNLYSQSKLFRLIFIKNETIDFWFFFTTVDLDFDISMEIQKKWLVFMFSFKSCRLFRKFWTLVK